MSTKILREFARFYESDIKELFDQLDANGQKAFMEAYDDLERRGFVRGMSFNEATTLSDREPRYIIGFEGEITAAGQALLEGGERY